MSVFKTHKCFYMCVLIVEEEQIQEVIKAQQATLKNKGKGQASTLQ